VHRFEPLRLALLILIFAFLETNFLGGGSFWKVNIELLLMLVIFVSLFSFRKQVYLCAFFCGLAKDIFSTLPFGLNAFLFLLIAFFTEKVSKNFFKEGKLIFSIFVFIATFIFGLFSSLFLGVYRLNFFRMGVRIILPTTFFTTLLSPLFFSFFKLVLFKNENK
jgi:rod shape-determining protein MreD